MTEAAASGAGLGPLPAFANPEEIFQRASAPIVPRKRMAPAMAAERYRMIQSGGQAGPWRNTTAPYMVEPMNETASREKEAVVFAGPARSSKTAALVENTALHRIICDPCPTLIVTTSQASARLFSLEKLDPMNRLCAEARRRLSPNRNDDNIYDKVYTGMRLVLGWPTLDHLTGKDYQLVLVTEYDRMPESIGGEGSVFEQARKRNQTFGSRGMTVVECSPGRDVVIDPENPWTPRGHEAPPTTGILDLFNQGDRRWWYWPCPQCGEYFVGHRNLLDWPKNKDGSPAGSIEEAAAAAVMICPHGCVIEPRSKADMNAAGRWLREGQKIDGAGNITGTPRPSAIASFWLNGPAASFQSWPGLVRNMLRAEDAFRRNGDVEALRGVLNVDFGEPYFPRPDPSAEILDPALIKARAETSWDQGTVPADVRALVITVDVQGRYFDIQVTGYGPAWECWIVDRWQIAGSAEDGRLCDPASHPEDWAQLWPVLDRAWPLADGSGRSLGALCMAIDSGGAPGVTGNAYRFAIEGRRRKIHPARLMLLKGDAKVGPKRIGLSKLDWKQDGRIIARGQQLLMVGSNDLKDDVAGALRRIDPGAGYVHTPHNLNAEWYAQVTAEQKDGKAWDLRPGQARNEAFDHMVYSRAALMRPPWRWDRIDWSAAPSWAAPLDRGNTMIQVGAAQVPPAQGAAPAGPGAAPRPRGPQPSRGDGQWLGPRRKDWLRKS
jgi:phage terminase large subunit GpA-like protein